MRNVYEGLGILLKYNNDGFSAGHDVIYAGPPDPSVVTPEDHVALEALGWFIDGEYDCWSMFV